MCLRTSDEVIDNTIETKGFWPDCSAIELAEDVLKGNCHAPRRYLDIGANIGACALNAAARGWEVVAVEPHPIHASLIKASGTLNSFGSAFALWEAAAVEKAGRVMLWEVLNNTAASSVVAEENIHTWREYMVPNGVLQVSNAYEVHGMRVDSLEEPYGFMKMDVEGHEEIALRGAHGLLASATGPKIIILEHWPNGMAAKKLNASAPLDILLDHGYRLFVNQTDARGVTIQGELWQANLTRQFPWEVANIWAVRPECADNFFQVLTTR